jgi:hypothetical protein
MGNGNFLPRNALAVDGTKGQPKVPKIVRWSVGPVFECPSTAVPATGVISQISF